ncbi:MAG: gliding motility-associated C-terminal domain-containing protein [Bacteroidota bacterium]|nr:gliding motility-associated C-terminal domain-containing protein [Bacteroidota bacterium]
MKKKYLSLAFFAIICFHTTDTWSQTYILNEDFSSASDTIPPAQWTNLSITPAVSDVWHFNNPGNRQLNYPVSGQFAIFDSENYSQNSLPDEAVLESPFFDASIGSYIFLFFDHYLTGNSGDTAFVEAFNGTSWQQVAIFTDSTLNSSSEMFNASPTLGSISNAKIRFRWKGNSNHFWAVDNISVFVPLVLDMGILSLANPQMPFSAGLTNIELNLKNFGALNITSATIQWQLNGAIQSPYSWTGNLPFSDTATNIVIGSHNFVAGQPVQIKAWIENPNSSFDANPLNDTLDINISASLCGTYTIGGTAPDFNNFTEAVTVLNNAGISCPVLFLVRDGVYDEQIEINSIQGTDSINTVTFRGESLDSTAAILDYTTANSVLNYTLNLNGTSWIRFEYMSFQRNGTWDAKIVQLNSNAHDINFTSCQIKNNRYGIVAFYGSKNIQIKTCSFVGGNIQYGFRVEGNNSNTFHTSGFLIQGNYFSVSNYAIYINYCANVMFTSNQIEGGTNYGYYAVYCSSIVVKDNLFENIDRGIHLHYSDSIEINRNNCNNLESYGLYVNGSPTLCNVWSNKFLNVNNANAVELKAPNISFYNNFIQVKGIAQKSGIYTNQNTDNTKIFFNSINLTNTNAHSAGITIGDADNLQIKNNIFANNGGGYAVKMLSMPTGLQLDYNDYFSSGIQLAQLGSTNYSQLSAWQTSTSLDANSVEANPFYNSETDLSCNQILLNNTAWAGTLITVDIDSTLRLITPDIGAREFTPCSVDAGINDIPGLTNPMTAGLQNINVTLQNQGNSNLTSCTIHWMVNGISQANFSWTGNLSSYQNIQVLIGSYNFQTGSNYNIEAWTSSPNSQVDCDNFNDTSKIDNLSIPLCGTYTIGGTAPDFNNFTEAVTVLNNAGISCPVLFLVRDGVYDEQIEINSIQGTDSINTVTFRGESLDSTAAILDYTTANSVLNYTLNLNGASWIRFEYMGFQRNGTWDAKIVQLNSNAHDINFTSCQIKNNRYGIVATYGSTNIKVKTCSFVGGNIQYGFRVEGNNSSIYHTSGFLIQGNYFNVSGYAIYTNGCTNVMFTSNQIEGGTNYGYYSEYCLKIVVKDNLFENINNGIYLHYSDSIEISQNNCNNLEGYGLFVNGSTTFCNAWGNKFLNVNNANAVELHAPNISFYNNFIHVKGIGQNSGIYTDQNTDNTKIFFNSINLTNTNAQSAGITIGDADNLQIKNNIFANNGGGYAVKMLSMPTGLQLDYNGYFSSGIQLAQLGSTNYSQISAWQTATSLDANSLNYNPYFMTDIELRPYQRELNGAGIPIAGILLDIDDQIRDENAPDIGADEFMVDFGITSVLSPDLHCALTVNDSVTVSLKQFGDIPFNNIQLAYQVNGGTIFTDVVTGSINNDITFTFNQTQNLSGYGTYIFKIWIINSFDDNINNDTITVYRYSNPVPQITANQTTGCAGTAIQFSANATIATGTIGGYFWEFGDTTVDSVQNPIHLYDTSGTYTVHLYAFSDVGCYNDTFFQSSVLTTPQADFIANNTCLGDTVFFTNLSTVNSGTMSYAWDFGNFGSSSFSDPYYLFSISDTFNVMLAALGSNGCADTIYQEVVVYPLPALSFLNLPTSFCSNDTALLLTVLPTGATVNSSACFGGWFYPSLATIGSNNISINYMDSLGCSDTLIASVDVLQAPTTGINGLASQYCISGEDPIISGFPIGGSFSGPGISGDQFSIANAGIGTHTLSYTFTSTNGCSDVAGQTVQVAEFNTFNLNFVVDSISCYGYSNGGIDLQVNFSTQNYSTLNWSNGAVSEDIFGLATGMYSVTLSDNFGCIFSDSVFITDAPNISISFTETNLLCYGNSDGAIATSVFGATPPYNSFLWSSGEITQDIANIPAGNYTITITDANNCEFTANTTITQPDDLLFNFSLIEPKCYDEATGAIDLSLSGATPPFGNFHWSNSAVTEDLANIPSGNYSITLSDANSCTFTNNINLSQPDSISLVFNVSDVLCYGENNGEVDLSISGGTAPFPIIHWSNGTFAEDISNLAPGNYQLTVTDHNNCIQYGEVNVDEPEVLTFLSSETNVLCYGEATGIIQLTALGGVSPYHYLWEDSSTDFMIENLEAGDYSVSIYDTNNCETKGIISINSSPEITINEFITSPSCIFAEDATISVDVSGGISPYSYIWSTSDISPSVTNLPAGDYNLMLTDSNLCQKDFIFTIPASEIPCLQIPNVFSPNDDGINDNWIIEGMEFVPTCKIKVLDRWGRTVFESSGYPIPWDGKYDNKPLQSDAYFYFIEYNNGAPPITGKVSIVY